MYQSTPSSRPNKLPSVHICLKQNLLDVGNKRNFDYCSSTILCKRIGFFLGLEKALNCTSLVQTSIIKIKTSGNTPRRVAIPQLDSVAKISGYGHTFRCNPSTPWG